MKKIICFFLCWLIISIPQIGMCDNLSYTNLDISSEDVDNINIQVEIQPVRDSKWCYSFLSNNKIQIDYIIYYLNSMKLIDDKKTQGLGADVPLINICINKKDGTQSNINFVNHRIYDDSNKEYGLSNFNEYDRLVDFVYGLKTKQILIDSEISFECSKWAEFGVNEALQNELVPKWNRFDYKKDISRTEVCELIDNILSNKGNKYDSNAKSPFVDTQDMAVNHLYEEHIINGKSETEFCPYDNITREEFSKILLNTYNVLSKSDSYDLLQLQYNDKEQISDWAIESVKSVTALGLMQGDENGSFNPQDNITKEQVIITLLKLNEII